jgi:hypothetical protein
MVRCLLRDVVGLGVVGELPAAGEYFAEDGVQGLLDPSGALSASNFIIPLEVRTHGGRMCQPLK